MSICPRCGEDNPDRARFCLACAAPLSAAAAAREERKVITVLFADLVGFTGQAERLDPEDVRALQDPYWRYVRSEIERHDGTVEKYIGDAVVGFFGAPVAHEDDPERAVRAGLAIRDWAREQDRIEVRIGITTGEALVRLGAEPLAGEGMASGDVVSTASRLQSAAPANSVLVDERSYRSTKPVIDYRDARPVVAKGKSAPVRVWEALQARSRFGVDVVQQPRTPLVGRKRELDVLKDALARVRGERSAQLVTIIGVPGIGKSRLVYELMRAVRDDPSGLVTWRQGRSLPYGDGVSFWALSEIVKAEAGILETDLEAEAEAKLAQTVRTLLEDGGDAEWVERHLRPLVGLGIGGDERGERHDEALAAWRRFFEALSHRRAAVVVFEDLHWADEGLLEFVDGLVEWVSDVPLLVLATARPELLERRRDWGGGKLNATTLSLPPLSDDETAELVKGLLPTSRLSPEAERALLVRAAGNALYAEQYAQMWDERREGGELPVPETVQGIIAARLDTLTPAEKALLQNGAVYGKVFWLGALLPLDGADSASARDWLHALERKGFVQRAQRPSVSGEVEYSFRHVLVRDVAYTQIPRPVRAEKHQHAASWIESLGRVEDHAELLAYHYAAALELAKAAGHASEELQQRAARAQRAAGERAFAIGAYAASMRYYRQALNLTSADDPDRGDLLLSFGRAARIAERAGADELLEARETFASIGDTAHAAEAHAALLELACDRRELDQTRRELEEAEILARRLEPNSSKAYLLACISRANMLWDLDDARAIAAGREALAIAERLELVELQAHALNNVGVVRVHTGDFGGIADLERAIELAAPLQSLELLRAYNNITGALFASGKPFREHEMELEGLRAAERLGMPRWIQNFRAEVAVRLLDTGEDWDEAIRLASGVIEAADARLATQGLARYVRCSIALARGNIELALTDSSMNVEVLDRTADSELWIELAIHARVLLAAGRVDQAARIGNEIQIVLNAANCAGPPTTVEALVQLGRGNDYLAALDTLPTETIWTDAARHWLSANFEAAAAIYASIGARTFEAYARLRAGEHLSAKGGTAEANEQLEQALAFYQSVGATQYIREAEALLAAGER